MAKNLTDIDGVGKSIAEKLRDANLDIVDIAVADAKELSEICEIGEATAKKIIQSARKEADVGTFKKGSDIIKNQQNKKRISTNSKKLDEILGGGIELGSLTEFYGEFASGKSQLFFQLSVNVQLPENKGGLNGEIAWIDSENTFNAQRVSNIAKSKGLNPEIALDKIHVARANNTSIQMLQIDSIIDLAKKHKISLLIVDSLIHNFRAQYPGRANLAERQNRIGKYLFQLQRFADVYDAAVVYSNQVLSNPGQFFGDPIKPCGGNVVTHAANSRIYIRKKKDGLRVARIVDSSYLPPAECEFMITENGIEDAE